MTKTSKPQVNFFLTIWTFNLPTVLFLQFQFQLHLSLYLFFIPPSTINHISNSFLPLHFVSILSTSLSSSNTTLNLEWSLCSCPFLLFEPIILLWSWNECANLFSISSNLCDVVNFPKMLAGYQTEWS